MRRRDFVAAVAGATLAGARAACAQSVDRPLVAYLGIASEASDQPFVAGLRRGLDQIGHVLGETLELDARYAGGNVEQFGGLIDAVVARRADVIVVPGIAAVVAVHQRAPQIPMVAVGLPS